VKIPANYLENEQAVCISGVKFYKGNAASGNAEQLDFVFLNKDAERKLSLIDLTDKEKEWKDNSYYMKSGMGYKAGDTLNLVYRESIILAKKQ